MKRISHLFWALLALFLPVQHIAAQELEPTVEKVTVYRIENYIQPYLYTLKI